MADERFNKIVQFLRSENLHYLDEWVRECIDHYVKETPNISEHDLWLQVKEQWLLMDLRDIAVPALPPNLKERPKVNLSGKYAVQVETMVDSGRPRYMQMKDTVKDSWENVLATKRPDDNDMPDRRCLTMNVTDGVQDLSAMEYEVIPELKLNDPNQLAGFKMLIIGPVMCKRGMIMLSRHNVKVLGGEVGSLLSSNNYQAILRKVLGIDADAAGVALPHTGPPPPLPRLPALPPPVQQVPFLQTQPPRQPMSAPSSVTVDDLLDDDDDFIMNVALDDSQHNPSYTETRPSTPSSSHELSRPNESQRHTTVSSFHNPSVIDPLDINPFRDELEEMGESQRPPASYQPLRVVQRPMETSWQNLKESSHPSGVDPVDINPFRDGHAEINQVQDFFNDDFDITDLHDTDIDRTVTVEEIKATKNISTGSGTMKRPASSRESSSIKVKNTAEPKRTKIVCENVSFQCKKTGVQEAKTLREVVRNPYTQQSLSKYLVSDQEMKTMEVEPQLISVSSDPFVYLDQICRTEISYDRMFKVKAQIITLKTKIGIKDDNFALTAKITDGSYSIDVNFSSDILENMLGFSPSEMLIMLREKKTNCALADKLREGFQTTQNKLIDLNCIFCLKFYKDKSMPTVVCLEEVTSQHLKELAKRQIK